MDSGRQSYMSAALRGDAFAGGAAGSSVGQPQPGYLPGSLPPAGSASPSRGLWGPQAGFDPQAAYRDYQRQRPMTLADLLLENRVIFLQGEIWDGNANELVMKLLYLQSENRRKDIHFYINSPGGSVTSTMAIYDTMQILTCPVATYCVGLAASGGAVLLAGGTAGKRFSLPHAKVMIHQPHGQVGGQVSDIEIQAREILKSREEINRILSRHCNKPVDQIARDTDRDFYMSAEESKQYGIVDDILTRPPIQGDEDT